MKTHRPLCQNFNKIYSLIDRYKIRGKNLIKDKIKILIISLRATDGLGDRKTEVQRG